MTAAAASARLPLWLKAGHGLGSVTYGVKEAGLTTFFMIYYNQVLGYDPRLVSLVLIGAMMVDALIDPAIGRLSDATRSRFGRRLPWLYLSALPMALAWALLWAAPSADGHAIGLLALNVVAVRLLVSACEIPSLALVAELTRDYDERTAMMRFRFLFGWLGGLLTTALAYGVFLTSDVPGRNGLLDPSGYPAFGLFGAAMIAITTIGSAWIQHRTVLALPPVPIARAHDSLIVEVVTAFRYPAFLALASGTVFVITSYATSIAASNYMMLYVWRFTDPQIKLFPIALVAAVLGAFLIVGGMHRRWGKRTTAVRFIVMGGAIWVSAYALRNLGLWPALGGTASLWLFLLFSTCALFCLIVTNISTSSMAAEIVEAYEVDHGVRREGVFFSGLMVVQKMGHALGIFLVGQMLALVGLGEQVRPDALAPSTVQTMAWLFAGIMGTLALLAALGLARYPITRADHEARLAALATTRGTENAPGD